MADLAEFSQPGFDPKAWINAACSARPEEESLERFLSELEMKLQLTAEDVEAALETHSNRILQRIPTAVQEVQRVKSDVRALQSDTQRIYDQLDSSHRKAAASVAPLASLDFVKGRMEGACNTLREATELSNLFGTVEEVFATGNLPRVADVLSTMRRSLAAVGDVPEFNDGWKQLESLENRLQAMVEGPLVHQLVGILVAIDRYSTVERLYVAARLAPLHSHWDTFDRQASEPVSFVQWLPRFFDEVLLCVEGEARWCQAVLPDLHPQLLLAMLRALFSKTRKGFTRRLEVAVQPQKAIEATSLAEVMGAQGATAHFARSLLSTLSGLTGGEASSIVEGFMLPFQTYLQSYGQLEAAVLANEVASLGLDSATEEELDNVVSFLSNTVPHILQTVEHAVDRCMKFTGGTEISALLRVVDDALAQYCSHLMKVVGSVRARCIPSEGSHSKANAEDAVWESGLSDATEKEVVPGEEVSMVIQLLGMANSLVGQLGVLDAQMHSVVVEAAATVERVVNSASTAALGTDAEVAANPAVVIIAAHVAANPKLPNSLAALLNQVQDQRYNALPASTQRASLVQQAVDDLVYDSLTHMVADQFKQVPHLPNWAEAASDNAFNLPSFSAYPMGYVSSVGEYLMTLPQQLEAWMVSEEEDTVSNIDAEWLDKVATGAAELYSKQLLAIPKLSAKGAQQLSADLEYFCNVLSALSVPLPGPLATIQVAVGLPEANFSAAAADALQQPFIDRRTFEQVATARGLSL